MKITAVTPFMVDPGYGKNWLFVKVETSDGLHGWGECYTQADRDHSIAAFVHQLARYLLGRDAGHIRHFTHWAYHDFAAKRGSLDFFGAVSGIEQALPITTSRPSAAPWTSSEPSAGSSRRSGTSRASGSACPW